jgi:hypothetical protein
MSDFLVLNNVSKALRNLLAAGFAADPQTQGDVGSVADITLVSPHEALSPSAGQNKGKLSLFLYQVQEDPFLKNQAMLPGAAPGQIKYPPLSLTLRYMITPLLSDPDKNQIILGRAMQILYDNATLSGDFLPAQPGSSPELRVLFDPLSFEETARLWTAMSEPFRLSVCYLVRAAAIDSGRAALKAPRVERQHIDMRQIVGAGERST